MLKIADRCSEHISMNKILGNNLRFIRGLKKMTLIQLAEKMKVKYQQVGKYELDQNQMCAFRLWQASNILGCKVKYFFDATYIKRMHDYHSSKIRSNQPMPDELLDIDKLQADVARELDWSDYIEERKKTILENV